MQENIDFVVCRECGFQGQSLNRHLGVHNITALAYRQKYPDALVVCTDMAERKKAAVQATWNAKPKSEIPKEEFSCPHCAFKTTQRQNYLGHLEREDRLFLYGEEGKDYITCRVCGHREQKIVQHISVAHGLTSADYKQQFPGALLILASIIEKAAVARRGKEQKPTSEKHNAKQCRACGEWYIPETAVDHLRACVPRNGDKYELGKDYVECPECAEAYARLTSHLKEKHGWSDDKIAVETGRGLQLMASRLVEAWRANVNLPEVQAKRIATMQARYGVSNPTHLSDHQAKSVETSQRRYGADHAMQTPEVAIRQRAAAEESPNGLERFFIEHVTCPNCLFVGYGGYFVFVKTGVRKGSHTINNLNPDFVILSDANLAEATALAAAHQPLDRRTFRTRYVIELLGDYYHGEAIIGLTPAEHEAEVKAAYASSGVECLTLWEKDVLERWPATSAMLDEWFLRVTEDLAASAAVRRKAMTAPKAPYIPAPFVCPHGSGRRFATEEALLAWRHNELNFWRPEAQEGEDFVVCQLCSHRTGKIAEHLRQAHDGMSKEEYQAHFPQAQMVSARSSRLTAQANTAKAEAGPRKYQRKVAYRCPDGKVVRKADAWHRAWRAAGSEPPADSIVDASSYDPWAGKVEGADFVACALCGYRAANLTRHLKTEHAGTAYAGPVKSANCEAALKAAAAQSWLTRRKVA